MNEQPIPTPDDDVEGHMPRVRFTPSDEVEDTEGHALKSGRSPVTDDDGDDDVEGHMPRVRF